jgi:uncharacterized integral membrane protein
MLMRIFSLVIKVAIFLLLLGFALKNTDVVTVRYFLGVEWQAPLAFVLLVLFAVGIVAGILTSLGVIVRQRRELSALKRELRSQSKAAAPVRAEAA